MDDYSSAGLSLTLGLSNVNGSPLQVGLALSEGSSERSARQQATPIPPVADANISTVRRVEELGNRLAEEEGGASGSRKKLKLSIEKRDILEKSFQQNSTPTAVKKKDLAQALNLRTRQVDDWFRNRRSRLKLKQTKAGCQQCEHLRKNIEELANENKDLKMEILRRDNKELEDRNRKLHMELQELKDKTAICPSCAKVEAADNSISYYIHE